MKPTYFAYSLTNYLAKYLPHVSGLSTNTILSYRDTFTSVIKFFYDMLGVKAEKITFELFNADHIIQYLDWLINSKVNSISTRNNRLAAIHAFAKYVIRHTPEAIYPMQEILTIPMMKCTLAPPKFLSLEAMQLLLSLPDKNTNNGRRDCVMLSLLYDSGARIQELCDIIVSDIRLEKPPVIKLKGKGSKSRIVPLMPQMAELLRLYFYEHKLMGSASGYRPLFINHCGNKFTRKGVAYILNKYFEIAKHLRPELFPNTISPHSMRHSKSMHLLHSGVNLIYIRDILGHADIKTTEIYARIDTEMKRKALEKASVGVISDGIPIWQSDKGLLEWLKSLG